MTSPTESSLADLWTSHAGPGLARYLRQQFPGPHQAKRIAAVFGIGISTAKSWLAGQRPDARSFDRMAAMWGAPFFSALYGSPAGDTDLCHRLLGQAQSLMTDLDRTIREMMDACNSTLAAHRPDPEDRAGGPRDGLSRDGRGACGERGSRADGSTRPGSAGTGAEAGGAGAPGRVLSYERLPLTAAGPAHREALIAWEGASRSLGEGLMQAMDAGGLTPGAGLYTEDSRILQIAAVTARGLLADPARIGMCGRHVRDLPIDPDYLETVDHDIRAASAAPLLTRAAITYGGGRVARYDNLRLPLPAARRVLSLTHMESL